MQEIFQVQKIYADKVVTFPYYTHRKPRTELQKLTEANLSRGKYTGNISKKAKSKIRSMAVNWVAVSELKRKQLKKKGKIMSQYFVFVTLTLSASQEHTDNEVKRELLNPFLIGISRKFEVENYIWKAEKQQNGNIHFHLILDRYIPHTELRNFWNTIQNRLGYIDRFESVHGHDDPNSTDIKRINNVSQAAIYIAKYLSKSDISTKVGGRLWGCSDNLRTGICVEEIGSDFINRLVSYHQKVKKSYTVAGDFFEVTYFDVLSFLESSANQSANYYLTFFVSLFNRYYPNYLDTNENKEPSKPPYVTESQIDKQEQRPSKSTKSKSTKSTQLLIF